MANKCSIPRKNPNSAPNEAELLEFAETMIIPSLMSIIDNGDYYNGDVLSPTKSRRALVAMMKSLGNEYTPTDHKYIAQALELALQNPFYSFFKNLLPNIAIIDLLKSKGTAEEVSSKIFTDRIEDDVNNDADAIDYFLHNAYDSATSAKMQLQNKMTRLVLDAFIINRTTGTIVSNIHEAIQNVEFYKKQLFAEIQQYFQVHGIDSPLTTADITNKSVADLIQLYQKEVSAYLEVGIIPSTEIQAMYDDAYNSNIPYSEKQKALAKLNAYGAWLALKHFDNFVKMSLGDTIIINPSTQDRYSYSIKGTNVNTTWRKSDDIDLQAEINKLTQALVETSPMLQFGSLTPIEGSYIQFSDFSYMTSKIKDLVYDRVAATEFFSDTSNVHIFNTLTEYEKHLVKHKSFRQIVSHCRLNPQKYLPLIYKILTTKNSYGHYFIDSFKNFNNQDKNILWSVYKTIYDNNFNGLHTDFHSLYSIQAQNPDSKNYYASVSSVADCIFSVNFVQYVYDQGVLKLRTLRDAAIDKTRREVENVINTKNSPELNRNFDYTPYDIKHLDLEGNQVTDEDEFSGMSFRLNLTQDDTNPDYLYIHVQEMGDKIKFSKSENAQGNELSDADLRKLDNNPAILQFFDEVLGLNISHDAAFRNSFKELTKEGNDDITPYIKQLLGYTSHVFMNRYFSHKFLTNKVYKRGKTNVIRKYYKDEKHRPRFNNQFFNMEMTPSKKYHTLLTLSQALGITRGVNSSRQVKDSDNAMLSSQSLSRLMGSLITQLDTQINAYNTLRKLERDRDQKLNELKRMAGNPLFQNSIQILNDEIKRIEYDIQQLRDASYLLDSTQNPAAANFALVRNTNLFKGIVKSEEIKGLFNNKKQVKFTTAEAVISSFLHNFVLGHCDLSVLEKNSEFGGGVVGLLPSVNSDKTTVGIGKFDLNAVVEGTNRSYISYNNQELQALIGQEIGTFYITMYNNIKDDFRKLQEFAYSKGMPIIINPDSNFTELNDYVDRINSVRDVKTSAMEQLFNLTSQYNKENPTHPIRLIDQIHFIVGKNGHIKRNNTIQSLISRYSDPENTRDFFNLKNSEVLKSALDSGFTINLYGNSNLDSQPEINYLRENYSDWINNAGQMIIAKVTIGGVVYNIANKSDLHNIAKILTLHSMVNNGVSATLEQASEQYDQDPTYYKSRFGYDNLINQTYLLKDIMQLHPMLEKYNLMDYLFTQELLLSTVGSHVAHPAKTSNTTSIIWAHPGIGKSYVVENTRYKNRIMDWDVEFNRRRDQWIAKHSGVDIASPDFAKTRTYYQINWKQIPDFQAFVASEWSRVKQKANDENKILVASPHMLLELFTEDFNAVYTMQIDDFVTRDMARRSVTKENTTLWKQGIDETINALSANPVFRSKVKSVLPHETLFDLLKSGKLDKYLTELMRNEMQEEASRFYAQHKRNVSFTASMDQFQLNQIDGIPTWYNIAILDDIHEDIFTIDGNTDSSKPFDGATFVNPFIVYLENNSLNEARAGIDKKQFVHYYDEMTGSGGIIKTAGFAITNDRIRESLFYRNMMKNMTNRVWLDYQGNEYQADITIDFKGNSVDYGTFYFKQGTKYYKATIEKGPQPNSYIRHQVEISKDGQEIGNADSVIFEEVNTNYKLWLMFGGMNSQEFNGGILQPSETSIQNVVKAMINTGNIKPTYVNGDLTAEHIDQPLKNADVHYAPTIGAVKQGAANINPNTHYGPDAYLNSFKIRMTQAGIQLDKEHHADDSKLSLMTQVISAACSMGYTPKQATKLYRALHSLTMQGIKEFRDSFQKLLQYNDPSEFETVIADCMIKNMLTSTSQDGDMLKAIAKEIIAKIRKGGVVTAEDAKSLPYSDPAVFEKLVSNLSVIMTKSGIKAKMNGILSVLCPTQSIVKMYSFIDEKGVRCDLKLSQLEELYGDTYENVIDRIQDSQPWESVTPAYDTTKIKIGYKYKVMLKNGDTAVMHVKHPHNTRINTGNEEIVGYATIKRLIKDGYITSIQEYVKDGRELASINFTFRGDDGVNYQLWDIDYIQDLYQVTQQAKKLKNDVDKLQVYLDLIIKYDGNLDKFNQLTTDYFINVYQNKGAVTTAHQLTLAKRYAQRIQQNILFSLSKNNSTKNNPVQIDGKLVKIDKNSIQTRAYELVMPKIFLEEFGLDNYANLDEIIKNPDYFFDRIRTNFNTKVYDETHYDIELKRVSGKHIYLKDRAGLQPNWDVDLEKVTINTKVDDLGRVWRIDLKTNKKMYEMFSQDDEVYRIPGTDVEIIVTSNKVQNDNDTKSGITFYLNNFKYNSIHISDAIAAGQRTTISSRPMFDDLMQMVENSTNKTAQSWINLFKGTYEGVEIELDKQGWLKDRVAFNKELNDFNKLGNKLRKHLKQQAIEVHTSLLKSLDIIAARIPAQNQQSFMPMRVVAFDNPNINTAYVSVMQFYLQGSDLDIDAVSLLAYSFSDDGRFLDWSPDFDMSSSDMLEVSMGLPFPTGNNLETVIYSEGEHVNISDRQALITDNEDFKILIQNYENPIEITKLFGPDTKKELMRRYIRLLDYINDNKGVLYFDTLADYEKDSVKQLLKRINKHNNYLNKVSDKQKEGAIKNYVVSAINDISRDAANMIEAHTGVDVATKPFKEIANASELSIIQKTFTPGNVFNKFQAIEEASVGKDDIAICATGLKAFFAATQFSNNYMNQTIQDPNLPKDLVDELSKLITFNPVEIGGKTFNSLANIRVDNLNTVNPDSQIYKTLLHKGFDQDASVIMSALLSLSTDNAKELCLAKLNAGTGMMGLYLYGAAIGMDFKVLNNIIASPLGFTVAKLLNGNEFTQTQGKTSVDAALTYLYQGPKRDDLKRFNIKIRDKSTKSNHNTFELFEQSFKELLTEDPHLLEIVINLTGKENIVNELSIGHIGKLLVNLVRNHGSDYTLQVLQRINDSVNAKIAKFENNFKSDPNTILNFKALNNQMFNFLNEFVDQTSTLNNTEYTTEYGTSDIAVDLNKLALGADEFKRLGQLLRLNQEIKTKSGELIDFVLKIESIVEERATIIKHTNSRLGVKNEKGINDLERFDFKEFAESFLLNPDDPAAYHNIIIQQYEDYCKTCVNPLRILTQVDHYQGYLTAMILAYEGDYYKSVKFRAIKHLGNKFIQDAKVKSKAAKTAVYKGVQVFIDEYINNAFLRSRGLLKLPKNTDNNPVYIVDENGIEIPNDYTTTHIQLGTDNGNRNFEHFFETTFIKALKEQFTNNIFVKDLKNVLVNDPISGVRYLATSLSINMMPTSDSERIIFNRYKNDFNKLAGQVVTINGNEYSIVEMFQYYNLLKFRGRAGRSSLLRIFEDVMANHASLIQYRQFINDFDNKYDFVIGEDSIQDTSSNKINIEISEEVICRYLAPISTPRAAVADVIKYKDLNTGQVVLLKRKPSEQDTSMINDDDLQDLMESYMEDDMGDSVQEELSYMEEGLDSEFVMDSDDYIPDYGDFEPIDGEGVLDRFNPPSIKVNDRNSRIIENYTIDGIHVKNIVIVDGKIKQLTIDGKIVENPYTKSIIKIQKIQNQDEQYILDVDKLNSIIKNLKC